MWINSSGVRIDSLNETKSEKIFLLTYILSATNNWSIGAIPQSYVEHFSVLSEVDLLSFELGFSHFFYLALFHLEMENFIFKPVFLVHDNLTRQKNL